MFFSSFPHLPVDCPPDSSRLIEIPPLVDLEEEIQLCQDVLHLELDGRLDAFHLGEDTGRSNTEPVSVEGGPRCTLHRQDGSSQPARADAHAYKTAAHPYHMAHMLPRGKQVFSLIYLDQAGSCNEFINNEFKAVFAMDVFIGETSMACFLQLDHSG